MTAIRWDRMIGHCIICPSGRTLEQERFRESGLTAAKWVRQEQQNKESPCGVNVAIPADPSGTGCCATESR